MTRIEFFFDCSSPWTYLAFTRIHPLAVRYGARIEWRPILVGGVFNAVNQQVYAARESLFSDARRLRHFMKDLQDWAQLCGVEIVWPDFHPVNAVKAMRGCLVAGDEDLLLPFARGVFEAYWGRQEDISDDAVLGAIAENVGLDAGMFSAAIADQACKDRLRANTNELIERGGYGAPTMFIDHDEMYFGNDRMEIVEQRLKAGVESKQTRTRDSEEHEQA